MLSFNDFFQRVLALLELEFDGTVNPYDGLYSELALDSFQALQLIIITESLADVALPPVDLPELYTAQDSYDYYVSLWHSVASGAP